MFKEINDMSIEELDKEVSELWGYLYMTKDVGAYDNFEYKGLDYWDADRRYHRLSQKALMLRMIKQTAIKAFVTDLGDPSVGIFSQTWTVECPFTKDDAEPEDFESFRERLIDLYYDFENLND